MQIIRVCAFIGLLSFAAAFGPGPAPAPGPSGLAPATAPSGEATPALACPCSLPPGYDPFAADFKAVLLATNCPVDTTAGIPGDCNYGFGNTGGCGNIGCFNHGTSNIGNYNEGTLNIGEGNHGTNNTGFYNQGTNNVGSCLDGLAQTGGSCTKKSST